MNRGALWVVLGIFVIWTAFLFFSGFRSPEDGTQVAEGIALSPQTLQTDVERQALTQRLQEEF